MTTENDSLLFRLVPLSGPLVTNIDMLCSILLDIVFNEWMGNIGYYKCQQTPRSPQSPCFTRFWSRQPPFC
jgi:hypothetical protein